MADQNAVTYRSRAALVKAAVRPAMPARLMISGPAGSGKTWSALTIARILVGEDGLIIVVDTETESALLYADEHRFSHLPWAPPYDPRELAATILELGVDRNVCIIVDSLTHFWHGEGGTLDIADSKFGGWKEATPAQDEMVAAMLRCRAHVIGCVREKQAYSVTETNDNGRKKQIVEKVGLQPMQREGLDYEFNVTVSMDMHHGMSVSKTRCRVLAGKSWRAHCEDEMAVAYRDWLAGGHPIIEPSTIAALKARVAALPNSMSVPASDIRPRCVADFKETFGAVDQLLQDDLAEAVALIATYEEEAVEAGAATAAPETAPEAAPEAAETPPSAPESPEPGPEGTSDPAGDETPVEAPPAEPEPTKARRQR